MKKSALLFACLLMAIPAQITAAPVLHKAVSHEIRQVSGFHGIASDGSYRVTVKLGDKESLSIAGDPDDISQVETTVEKGILVIKNKSSFGWSSHTKGKITISITAKSLSSLSESGSGLLEVADEVKTNNLSTEVAGSGRLLLSTASKNLSASISGSGAILIKGSSQSSTITITGSGSFNGQDLVTADVSVKITGSGNVRIHADKTIDALLIGSGSVLYSGNATVDSKKIGSGSVMKIKTGKK